MLTRNARTEKRSRRYELWETAPMTVRKMVQHRQASGHYVKDEHTDSVSEFIFIFISFLKLCPFLLFGSVTHFFRLVVCCGSFTARPRPHVVLHGVSCFMPGAGQLQRSAHLSDVHFGYLGRRPL
jgi:hypothetical protein